MGNRSDCYRQSSPPHVRCHSKAKKIPAFYTHVRSDMRHGYDRRPQSWPGEREREHRRTPDDPSGQTRTGATVLPYKPALCPQGLDSIKEILEKPRWVPRSSFSGFHQRTHDRDREREREGPILVYSRGFSGEGLPRRTHV